MCKRFSLYTPEGLPIVSCETIPRDFGKTIEDLPKVYRGFIQRENKIYLRFIENISESFLYGNDHLQAMNVNSLAIGYVLLDTQGKVNEGENWRGLPKVSEDTYIDNYLTAIEVFRSIEEGTGGRELIREMMKKFGDENLEIMKGHLNWVKMCKDCYGQDAATSAMVTSAFSYNTLKNQAVKDQRAKAILN